MRFWVWEVHTDKFTYRICVQGPIIDLQLLWFLDLCSLSVIRCCWPVLQWCVICMRRLHTPSSCQSWMHHSNGCTLQGVKSHSSRGLNKTRFCSIFSAEYLITLLIYVHGCCHTGGRVSVRANLTSLYKQNASSWNELNKWQKCNEKLTGLWQIIGSVSLCSFLLLESNAVKQKYS